MPESIEPRKIIRATREIVVNINGEEFDAILIPREVPAVIDFTQFPEDDPLRRQINLAKLVEVNLAVDTDLRYAQGGAGKYQLTLLGAKRLLQSL
jgi:hypothetical protein